MQNRSLNGQVWLWRTGRRSTPPMLGHAGLRGQVVRTQTGGFTLIELVIAVAIVAILSVIALPSYNNYVLKAKRMDAKIALLDMASRQERFFSINNTYTSVAANLGYAALPASVPSSGTPTYQISVSAASSSAYSLTATPNGDQLKDSCGSYTINQLGVQSNVFSSVPLTTALSADCWR